MTWARWRRSGSSAASTPTTTPGTSSSSNARIWSPHAGVTRPRGSTAGSPRSPSVRHGSIVSTAAPRCRARSAPRAASARRLSTARPHVVETLRGSGEQRPVDVRVLRDEARAVALVQEGVAEPRRQQPLLGEPRLRPAGHLRRELHQLVRHGVRVAALGPGAHHREPVRRQRGHMTAPHRHGRMPLPAVGRHDQGAQDLQGLDPLLAEPRPVEHMGGLVERREREERLHRVRA